MSVLLLASNIPGVNAPLAQRGQRPQQTRLSTDQGGIS